MSAGVDVLQQPSSLLGHRLEGLLRPEFRDAVIIPVLGSSVMSPSPCQVHGCTKGELSRGLCSVHLMRWRRDGRPDKQDWLANADPAHRGQRRLSNCAVGDCRRGVSTAGLCGAHFAAWRRRGRPDLAFWLPEQTGSGLAQYSCVVIGCEIGGESPRGLCRSHLTRWHQRECPPIEAFVAHCATFGVDKFDLRRLPTHLRLEFAYGLQCRVDDNRVRTLPRGLLPVVNYLADSGAVSLLERPAQAWNEEFGVRQRHASAARAFLRYTLDRLEDVQGGVGMDAEYERDIWSLRRIGYFNTRTATLRFDRIGQPWLREMAKRWIRWRLSVGLSRSLIQGSVMALTRLSEALAELEPVDGGVRSLDRQLLERYLAWLGAHLSTRGRIQDVGAVTVFLRHLQQHDWAPGLPRSAALYPDDMPRRERAPARALSEYVMAQLESERALAACPTRHFRLLTELLIRTGLRVGDARKLAIDCLLRDEHGAAYLRYLNHKMRREAFVPIDEDLAVGISAQQQEVRAKWPEGRCLFPAPTANPEGRVPLPYGTYMPQLKRWLLSCDVRDENGQPAKITPHQWRHTYGTRMINAEVPQHVVKRLLDHSSDEMTAHYARLSQQTVRRHWERATRVNILGESVPVDPTSPLAEAMWTKESLARVKMALPNGYCTLPLQKSCEHANACLTCPLFLTTPEFLPDHQRQLAATRDLITTAQARGHTRLAESNQQVEKNLLTIIGALQSKDSGCCQSGSSCGCTPEPQEAADAG